MSAQPVDPSLELPHLTAEEAVRADLTDAHGLARIYRVDVNTMKAALRKESAPTPIALAAVKFYGRHAPLYDRDEIIRWVDSETGPGSIGNRRRSAPVRLIGTSTPTAGKRPYQWRDPGRPMHRPATAVTAPTDAPTA